MTTTAESALAVESMATAVLQEQHSHRPIYTQQKQVRIASKLQKHRTTTTAFQSSSTQNFSTNAITTIATSNDYHNANDFTDSLPSDVFTSKHANSLIDIKRAYYEVFTGETEKEIFVSYESNSNLQERKFIVDLVRQLKENHLNDDIWFDKDELIIGKPTWTVTRLEAAEHSSAAVLIVTPGYFENPLSIYESKTLYDHKCTNESFYLAVVVLYIKGYPRLNNTSSTIFNDVERVRARKVIQNFTLLQPIIDKANLYINLSDPKFMTMSVAEKVSYCVGSLTNNLEKHAKVKRAAPPMTPFDESDNVMQSMQDTPFNMSFAATSLSVYSLHTHYGKTYSIADTNSNNLLNRGYLFKSLISFKPNDVQQFLEDLGVDEYFRNNFADFQCDGYLMTALCEEDLTYVFDIDNKVMRKKIRSAITDIMQKELQADENWHLQLKYTKPLKANSVYLIFDPQDHPSIVPFLNELKANNVEVVHHHGFGSSKEEFVRLNATAMAQCKFVLVYLTENSAASTFVFHECTFSQLVINKPKLITIMVKNVWKTMRHTLKAILGDHLALDFTGSNLKTNVKPLLQFFRPRFNAHEPLIKLEVNNVDENALKSLDLLANTSSNPHPNLDKIKVFISQVTDHWDAQRRLEQLLNTFETFNIKCWFDLFSVENQRLKNNPHTRSMNHFDDFKNMAQVNVNNNAMANNNNASLSIRTAQVLICCITPKYLTSDVCVKDVNLADALHIPIIPVLLRPCVWPPENVQYQIRRSLNSLKCIDISNDALFKRNLPHIISAIHHSAAKFTKQNGGVSSGTKSITTAGKDGNFNDATTNSEYSLSNFRVNARINKK